VNSPDKPAYVPPPDSFYVLEALDKLGGEADETAVIKETGMHPASRVGLALHALEEYGELRRERRGARTVWIFPKSTALAKPLPQRQPPQAVPVAQLVAAIPASAFEEF
jgi:hypothetical protein